MCSGPGFMGYYLMDKFNLSEVQLVDINYDLEETIKLTNKENNWNGIFHFSNGLLNYNGPKVDFIISNLSSFDFTPPAVLLLSEPQ